MAESTERTVLARTVLGETDDEKRKTVLEAPHPKHTEHSDSWILMADAYDGAGGFLDGAYLWRFPAEIPEDYTARQAQARYHNFVATLVDIYVRYVSQGVTRTAEGSPEYADFLTDVDGAGTSMETFVKQCATDALLQGHCGALIDTTPDAPTGPAKADEKARVIATRYPAPSIVDWRLNGAELTGVKLSECAPPVPITAPPEQDEAKQWLLWDTEEWARFDAEGAFLNDGTHDLGLVPLAVLRPLPAQHDAFIGRMLLGNANVVRALYNRASEEDHVLRNQGFSLLTVQAPADATAEAIDKAKTEVSANYGTARAIVTVGAISYQSPDMAIPDALRENMTFLVRELYRAAHVNFNSDTRLVESAEALQIKQAELTEMLRALASALSAFELRIARCWFAWKSATPKDADAAFEKAKVTAQYAHEFILKDLESDLKAWADAVRFGLPPEFVKRMKKRIVRRIEPDIPADVAKTVDDAIDNEPDAPAQGVMVPGMDANALRDRATQRMAAAGQAQAQPAQGAAA